MAELLKRQYDLLSFKIRLDTAGEEPQVRCALEVTHGGQLQEALTWVFSTAAILWLLILIILTLNDYFTRGLLDVAGK